MAVFLIWAFANKKNIMISKVREKRAVMVEVQSVAFMGKDELKKIPLEVWEQLRHAK